MFKIKKDCLSAKSKPNIFNLEKSNLAFKELGDVDDDCQDNDRQDVTAQSTETAPAMLVFV